ncbi:MAG: hypothetical protein U0559_04595 [Anaerolineae bacterium]
MTLPLHFTAANTSSLRNVLAGHNALFFPNIEQVLAAACLALLLGDHHAAIFVKDDDAILRLPFFLPPPCALLLLVFDIFDVDVATSG